MELDPAIVHYCKYQERCHQEVRNKLYELGKRTNDVEEQVMLLIDAGLLNEERFACAYARGKFRMKQWGRQKIKMQLKLKKVSDYCIKKALIELNDDEYYQSLHRLAQRKIDELKQERSILGKKFKVFRYLMQKGYEKDLISDVMAEILSE